MASQQTQDDASKSVLRITVDRFKKNLPGVISFWFILLIGFVALFAYALAPDNTTNANTMHLALSNKSPGFSIDLIQVKKPDANRQSFLSVLWDGRTPLLTSIPVTEYKAVGDSIYYREYIGEGVSSPEKAMLKTPLTTVKKTTFYLGTDRYGRDLLSRMIIGSRISFTIGFVAVLIAIIIGVSLGAIAGYFGGKVDAFIMWLINIMWSIPTLLMVIAVTFALGKGVWQVYVAVGLTMWVEVARMVRGQVISAKQMQYVEAARALGFGKLRIIARHILPNIWGVVIVITASNFASAILMESGLSFLGLGAQPPIPSWGGIIRDHYMYMVMGKPYLALVPGTMIMLLVLAFMTFGNTLRDALDVKS